MDDRYEMEQIAEAALDRLELHVERVRDRDDNLIALDIMLDRLGTGSYAQTSNVASVRIEAEEIAELVENAQGDE